MAFQQPQQRPQVQRPSIHVRHASDTLQVPASPAPKRSIEESQEWILFSPQHDDGSHTSEGLRTATSLQTQARSHQISSDVDHLTNAHDDADDDSDNDQAELDSLDDGLHAFHHPFSTSSNPLDQSGGTVLPRHDGFGMFPSSAGLQEQLWQFERYNPHRKKHIRRRSSVHRQLENMEECDEMDVDDERTARIEKWRLDQSKAIMEDIDRETRRRRRRMSRAAANASIINSTPSHSAVVASVIQRQLAGISEETHETKSDEPSNESFWQRITRKVIQDLIGLDDSTLSVILGESLPADPSPTPRQQSPLAVAAQRESRVTFGDTSYNWESKLLDRIARELGVLVHQLSSGHEGAFNAYTTKADEMDYAGLGPLIRDPPLRTTSLRQQRRQQSTSAQQPASDLMFAPTLTQNPASPSDAPDSSLWGIEEEPLADPEDPIEQHPSKEYWERDLDMTLILNYLRERLSRLPLPAQLQSTLTDPANEPPSPPPGPLPSTWTTSATARETSLRRAEIIRRQHPLVSRAAQQQQQTLRRQLHHEALLRRQMARGRAGAGSSSCSTTRRSRHSRSASSRHFWDLGGSVGSVASGAVLSTGGHGGGGWGDL